MTSPTSPVSALFFLPSPTVTPGFCLLSPGISMPQLPHEFPSFLQQQLWLPQTQSLPVPLLHPAPKSLSPHSSVLNRRSAGAHNFTNRPGHLRQSQKLAMQECRQQFHNSLANQVEEYKSRINNFGLKARKDIQGNRVCSMCEEVLPDRSDSLQRHAPSHMGPKKPFSCCFCYQKYSRRDTLKRHFDNCPYVQEVKQK